MIKVEKWDRKEKPSLEELWKVLEKEGMQPYTFTGYPGDYYGEHIHKHDEIRICISGKMRFGADAREIVLEPGDKLFVSKGTVHWAEVVGKEKAVLLSASNR